MDNIKNVEVDLTNSYFKEFPTFGQKHITFSFETTRKRRGWIRCLTKTPGETEY